MSFYGILKTDSPFVSAESSGVLILYILLFAIINKTNDTVLTVKLSN